MTAIINVQPNVYYLPCFEQQQIYEHQQHQIMLQQQWEQQMQMLWWQQQQWQQHQWQQQQFQQHQWQQNLCQQQFCQQQYVQQQQPWSQHYVYYTTNNTNIIYPHIYEQQLSSSYTTYYAPTHTQETIERNSIETQTEKQNERTKTVLTQTRTTKRNSISTQSVVATADAAIDATTIDFKDAAVNATTVTTDVAVDATTEANNTVHFSGFSKKYQSWRKQHREEPPTEDEHQRIVVLSKPTPGLKSCLRRNSAYDVGSDMKDCNSKKKKKGVFLNMWKNKAKLI